MSEPTEDFTDEDRARSKAASEELERALAEADEQMATAAGRSATEVPLQVPADPIDES